MKYFQIDFTLNPYNEDVCDVLSSTLADIGFETFVPTAQGITAYVQQNVFEEEYLKRAISDFVLPGYSITYNTMEAPDEDWNQTWEEEGFEPIVLDDMVCVHDTRHQAPPSRYDIIINPRMAFGTGAHPTTQQILRYLTEADLQGKKVIDAGCGTGVLSILASMRGASHVFSYDIDEWSVENTRINAGLNGTDNIEVQEGDANVLPQDGKYDLLIANINRNILLEDMEQFAKALKLHGRLLLSGFYETDVPMLIERARELGFVPEIQTTKDGWAMLMLQLCP